VDETRTVFRGHGHRLGVVQNRVQDQDEHGECRTRKKRDPTEIPRLPDTDSSFRPCLQLTVVTGWAVSSAVLGSLIFGLHGVELHPILAAAYSSLSHTLWALCLSWTVIACATGHGGKNVYLFIFFKGNIYNLYITGVMSKSDGYWMFNG